MSTPPPLSAPVTNPNPRPLGHDFVGCSPLGCGRLRSKTGTPFHADSRPCPRLRSLAEGWPSCAGCKNKNKTENEIRRGKQEKKICLMRLILRERVRLRLRLKLMSRLRRKRQGKVATNTMITLALSPVYSIRAAINSVSARHC